MKDVSIIIVNYNTAQLILDCISSIIRFTQDISYEIIVVDNHSQDELEELLKKNYEQVIYIQLPENIGFGRANNKGIEIATGRNIILLNPDTLLLNNALKIMSNYLDDHASVGACGGNLYDEKMQPTLSFRRLYPSIRWELSELTVHKVEQLIYHGSWNFNHTNHPLDVAYITGADLMVKRQITDHIGGFSDVFFMYNEDTDLCLRISNAGYRIISIPSAHIQHLEGKSTRKGSGQINEKGLFLSEQGRQRYYQKNVSPIKRAIAQMIYRTSLYLFCFISRFFKNHSKDAFLYRIKVQHSL